MGNGRGKKTSTPNKKRKMPPSLSPRRGKRKLLLTEVQEHVQSSPQEAIKKIDPGASTSKAESPYSIKSFFAKAKPPQYTSCPVCSVQVKICDINRHLDSGCLSQSLIPVELENETSTCDQHTRSIANVRTDRKDRKTRCRLQDKFESSPMYQNFSLSTPCDQRAAVHRTQSMPAKIEGNNAVCNQSSSENLKVQSTDEHDTGSDSVVMLNKSKDKRSDKKGKAASRLSLKNIKAKKVITTIANDNLCSEPRTNSGEVNSGPEGKVTSPYFDKLQRRHSSVSPSQEKVHSRLHHSASQNDAGISLRTVVPCTSTKAQVEGFLQSSRTSSTSRESNTGHQELAESMSTSNALTVTSSSSSELEPHSDPLGVPMTTLRQTPPEMPPAIRNGGKSPNVTASTNVAGPSWRSSLPTTPRKPASLLGSPATSPASSTTRSPGSPHKPKEPYYMVNFKLILNAVLKNEFDTHLFNDEDHSHVGKFNGLSGPAQQLYVRLFQRKFTWFRVAKIEYPRIAVNLKPYVGEMIHAGLLMTESCLSDLPTTLNLLLAPDIKLLAKEFKVNGGQKGDLVTAILKYSASQRSIFTTNMDGIVMKRAKKLLGPCVKLIQEPRALFNRILLLFSLVRQDLMDEDKGSAGQSALYTELLVNMGKMSYPVYTVYRSRSFFASRRDLLRYETAIQYERDIAAALGINDFDLADKLQTSAMAAYEDLARDKETFGHDESLPEYLRCFSAGWVYTHVRHQGVEIRQKQRRYEEAVDLLRAMLRQTVYCPDRRGNWWDRLALNLDQHCKKQHEALDCIKEGLADSRVQTGHRLALELRAQKILKSKRRDLAARADEFHFQEIHELPKVTIEGTVLPHHGPGVRNTFISCHQGATDADEGIVVCSVEQVALEHYLQQGYTEGIHGEGSTYTTLIFILFWDIVFQPDIPDVLCYPYQSAPLDLRTDHFYQNRQEALEERFEEVRRAGTERLQDLLETSWQDHEGDMCVGVNWEIFRGLDHAKGLMSCIGGEILSSLARRILTSHRHCRAGLPDLTMWNPQAKKFRVVEVKGPGDRLSQKQILWLDFFLRHGVQAEVCHVEAVGSKRLRRRLPGSQDTATTSSQDSAISLD